MKEKERIISNIIKKGSIVQQYPPLSSNQHNFLGVSLPGQPYFFEDEIYQSHQRSAIVEDYREGFGFSDMQPEAQIMEEEDPQIRMQEQQSYLELFGHRESRFTFDHKNILDSSSGRQLPSRNSSVSSISSHSENISPNPHYRPQIGFFHDQFFNTEQEKKPVKNTKVQYEEIRRPRARRQIGSSTERKQRQEKIKKLRVVGCNCKKTKCLKMYCQCFNLQILCGQNCNCVDCGNMQESEHHKKAVLDALTRNPRAFAEDAQVMPSVFKLGVDLNSVRKGCKCKKTQCRKKYCECFNSGVPCGIFCQCQKDDCHNQPSPR